MKKSVSWMSVILLTLQILGASAPAIAATFHSLGEDFVSLGGLSHNGTWVIGTQISSQQPECPPTADCVPATIAVKWSMATGPQPLPEFWEGLAISDDGNSAVGRRQVPLAYGPFVWTQSDGAIDLGQIDGKADAGNATDITPDGKVAVGAVGEFLFFTAYGGSPEAFRWSQDEGIIGLGDLDGGDERSFATAVSASGDVVVGEATTFGNVGGEAFVWTADAGMRGLGFVEGLIQSISTNVSSDGKVAVGYGHGLGETSRAFRWSQDQGLQELGPGIAHAANGNGDVIVGWSFGNAYLWTKDGGPQDLQEWLIQRHGLGDQLNGWTLTTALDVSDDGRTIVGYGENPMGSREAWIVIVPEPGSLFLALTLAVAMTTTVRPRGLA